MLHVNFCKMFRGGNYISTERFISEVKERPAIWYLEKGRKPDKSQRYLAWRELCEIFCENYSEKTLLERTEVERALQRKWKSLRDSFTRELSRRKHSDPSKPRKKEEEDEFDPLECEEEEEVIEDMEKEESNGSIPHQKINIRPKKEKRRRADIRGEEDISENQNTNLILKSEISTNNKKDFNDSTNEQKLVDVKTMLLQEKINEDDEDKLFLLSLHKTLKKIPEENKIDVKVGMLQVLKTWQYSSTLPSEGRDSSSCKK